MGEKKGEEERSEGIAKDTIDIAAKFRLDPW